MSDNSVSRFSKDSLYNLAGQVVPMAVAVVCLPVLLQHLGSARVGVLSIAWVIVGYSGLLDLGLSRSLLQITAALRSRDRHHEIPEVFWTAVLFATPLSLLATIAFFLNSDALAISFLNVPVELVNEVASALRIFALSVGPAIVTPLLLGFLCAYRRFDLVNRVKLPTGVLMTGGPALVAALGYKLPVVMCVLVLARIIGLLWSFRMAFAIVPALKDKILFRMVQIRTLLGFGLWITITNVVSPVLVYCDRFIIGSVLSVVFVAYYATPLDAITKLLVFPSALVAALFPLFVEQHSVSLELCKKAAASALRGIFITIFPLAFLIILFSREALQMWLGQEFAYNGTLVLQVLALGLIMNAMAQVPATFVQAVGRPELAARLHVVELIVYVPILVCAVQQFGIQGAACVWTLRVSADALLLYRQMYKILGRQSPLSSRDGVKFGTLMLLASFGIVAATPVSRTLLAIVTFLWFYASCGHDIKYYLSRSSFLRMRLSSSG